MDDERENTHEESVMSKYMNGPVANGPERHVAMVLFRDGTSREEAAMLIGMLEEFDTGHDITRTEIITYPNSRNPKIRFD